MEMTASLLRGNWMTWRRLRKILGVGLMTAGIAGITLALLALAISANEVVPLFLTWPR